MKRIAAIAIFCMSVFSSASAEFYAESPEGALPPGTTSLQYFIDQQVAFLTHLERCEDYVMKARSPTQPTLLIVKEILGLDEGTCHVRTLTYPVNQVKKGLSPSIVDCHLKEKNIVDLTSFSEYEYIRNLDPTAMKEYTFSAVSPTLALPKNICK